MKSTLVQQWDEMVTAYFECEKTFLSKHKIEAISSSLIQRVHAAGGDSAYMFREYTLMFLALSIIIHFVVSMQLMNINFLSLPWLLFYLALSALGAKLLLHYKYSTLWTQRKELTQLKKRLDAIEKFYLAHQIQINQETGNSRIVLIQQRIALFKFTGQKLYAAYAN
jgi:hypothetical protein